jgi:bifunctional N-acetylglucosamine-1-phosphate-uridyltransferase/glucosamine-1-phosphate-acetyltransferase GlmU-like protein
LARLRVLIAAAGSGSRSGLPYPKTLHPVLGRPILARLVELLRDYDPMPAVVVSPTGRAAISDCLREQELEAELIEQPHPTGMGDAILSFRESTDWGDAEHLLTVWGDIPLLQPDTVAAVHSAHFRESNDFTFATRLVDQAYTVVDRDEAGRVRSVGETREMGVEVAPGERDIGLFLFRITPVFALLDKRLPGCVGETTGEHGFLYVIRHLVDGGYKVEASPVATELDLVSLNRLSDLASLEPGPNQ